MRNLNYNELRTISGGEGFAHDVGCGIRYALAYFSYGRYGHKVGKAVADAATSGGCSE